MWALSSSSPLILRCIFRRPPPSIITHYAPSFFKRTPALPSLVSSTRLSSLIPRSLSTIPSEIVTEREEERVESHDSERVENLVDARISSAHKELLSKLKSMSVKEKKELGSYANSLGKKLKSQQVGKSGVTDSVATALLETLEANELLKLKIHNNCPGELDEVVSRLEEATGSVVVGRIGRTVIIYRPSLTKLKAEEKKKQAMKVFLKRRAAFKSSYQGRTQGRAQSGNRSRDFTRS
ncbi:hypothetical protein QVD17_14471 [Tagetes erecta]|uniref:CRM domain-containing protein n=1 Tax=Tagetes erecta TaxID=13708 RepID=A0AAD8KZ11_TARER|nr:hypothetical protein QVD17_14471 [Tagetes erecta]